MPLCISLGLAQLAPLQFTVVTMPGATLPFLGPCSHQDGGRPAQRIHVPTQARRLGPFPAPLLPNGATFNNSLTSLGLSVLI